MTVHFLVMAGAKPFACYTTQAEADAAKTFLGTAGVNALTIEEVTPGLDGDPAATCDAYLNGKDAIVSETVTLLNA